MKMLLALVLALCTVLSVHAAEEVCGGSVNCTCDLSAYNSSATPPLPNVTCPNGGMTIYISKCQLEKSLFNTSNLSLLNNTGPQCKSQEYLVDGQIQVGFHNPMSSTNCGNNVAVNATHVIYANTLFIYAGEHNKIITKNNASVNVSCAYPLEYPVHLNISLKPISSTTNLEVPGVTGALSITMAVFTDSSFTVPVTEDTVLYVEQTVYVQVWIPSLEADTFSIKVLRLYATPGGSVVDSGLIFNLTSGVDGCPDPDYGSLISVLQNGNSSEARFQMQVFKITDQSFVNLYADVTICPSSCEVSCNQRIVKSSLPENVATINVQLTADNPSSGATDSFSLSWTLVSLISSLLFAKFM